MKWLLALFSFYRVGDRDTERPCNFSKVTQEVPHRAERWFQNICIPWLLLYHL